MGNTSDSFMPGPLLFCMKIERSVCYKVTDNSFLPDVVEAFFVRKMKGLPLVSTKQDMQDFLKVSTPHYFGGKFTVSNIPYYSEEEELLLWSETSLRGPVISAGYERYMELFKKILPQKAEQINFL